ncbi:PIG-L family deacetylase [Oceanospirillaceae bacterium]|nr:PIG-L family deacetylase [Oceanospirillaceae bacterium]
MKLSESSSLFIFAHQDDECGCFFELHRLVAQGEKVFVVYLTSGTPDGNTSHVRDTESINVLGKLGVPSSNIYFLGSQEVIPDGHLSSHLNGVYQSILNLIGYIGLPQRLYFLAWEGGHQDHDAAHLIGLALGKRLGVLENCFQFTLYTGQNLPSIFFKLFAPLPDNGARTLSRISWRQRFQFLSYCLCYPSQKTTWLGLFPFFIIHYLFSGTQIFQPVSLLRIMEQPHTGTLLYERRGFYSYQEFNDASEDFIQKNLIATAKVDS